MKVLHINTVASGGGAANSMRQLHRSLLESGVDSRILALMGESESSVSIYGGEVERNSIRHLAHSILIAKDRSERSNTHYSLNAFGESIADHPEVVAADVIHLHWVADFFSSESIAQLAALGKPIIWTLHDTRPFTGGCHFPAGCSGFQSNCAPCEQLVKNPGDVAARSLCRSIELFKSAPITLVAPSRWMQIAAQGSAAVSGSVEYIPYGIDARRFAPSSQLEARIRLGLDSNARYLMLGAHTLYERRKGMVAASEILRTISEDPQYSNAVRSGAWRLLVVGGDAFALDCGGWQLDTVGYLSPERMPDSYGSADALLFPSLEDNLPNMVMEASACGLPTIGFSVGGLPDLVQSGTTGVLVPLGAVSEAATVIGEFLMNGDAHRFGFAAREKMQSEFSLERQVAGYLNLYHETLSRPQNHRTPGSRVSDDTSFLTELALRLALNQMPDALAQTADFSRQLDEQRQYIQTLESECEERLRVIGQLDSERIELNARNQFLSNRSAWNCLKDAVSKKISNRP